MAKTDIKNPSIYVQSLLTCEARTDLQMWSSFIDNYNGKSLILNDTQISSDRALLFRCLKYAVEFIGLNSQNLMGHSF